MGEASLGRNTEVFFGSFESAPHMETFQEALDLELGGVSGMEEHMWGAVRYRWSLMPGTAWSHWGVQMESAQSGRAELWGSPRDLGDKEEPKKENDEEGCEV